MTLMTALPRVVDQGSDNLVLDVSEMISTFHLVGGLTRTPFIVILVEMTGVRWAIWTARSKADNAVGTYLNGTTRTRSRILRGFLHLLGSGRQVPRVILLTGSVYCSLMYYAEHCWGYVGARGMMSAYVNSHQRESRRTTYTWPAVDGTTGREGGERVEAQELVDDTLTSDDGTPLVRV